MFTFTIQPLTINVKVAIPALDRLMDYLETAAQTEVDTATAELTASTSGLKTAVDANQPK